MSKQNADWSGQDRRLQARPSPACLDEGEHGGADPSLQGTVFPPTHAPGRRLLYEITALQRGLLRSPWRDVQRH